MTKLRDPDLRPSVVCVYESALKQRSWTVRTMVTTTGKDVSCAVRTLINYWTDHDLQKKEVLSFVVLTCAKAPVVYNMIQTPPDRIGASAVSYRFHTATISTANLAIMKVRNTAAPKDIHHDMGI